MNSSSTMNDTIRYTNIISKGTALINETRTLLNTWEPDEPLDEFIKRVQEQDLLGKTTAYRTRDIVRRVFAQRFLIPSNKPARVLKGILNSNLSSATFIEMLFVYCCRKDPLIRDFTSKEFWSAVKKGKINADHDLVLSFLSEAAINGNINPPWSNQVQIRVSRSLLGMLRDIGFIHELKKGRKEIANYRVSDDTIAILARDLHESGISDAMIFEHPDWRIFGLTRNDVLERLNGIGREHGFVLQWAGSVVQLTWNVSSIQEMIDVLSR